METNHSTGAHRGSASTRKFRALHHTCLSKVSVALWVATWACSAITTHAASIAPAGQKTLSLWAGAYYDQQRFDKSDPNALIGSVSASDVTGDSVSGNYGSIHQASANGSVTANSISLYSRSYAYVQTAPGYYYTSWADATARANVTTPFLVQGGGAPGTSGTLVVPLHVSGSVDLGPAFYNQNTWAEAHGQASMYFWATGLNASGCSYYTDAGCLDIRQVPTNYPGGVIAVDTVINSNNPSRTWTLHIPFQFDSWSTFYLQMWTGAESYVAANLQAGGIGQHFAESDFGHTLRWGGISEVLDANGQPVNGWSIQSLPGVDLRVAAVPIPGSFGLMMSGLGLLGWVSRRRHR